MRYLPAILLIGLVAGTFGGCSGAGRPSGGYASPGNLSDSWGWDAASVGPGFLYNQSGRYFPGSGGDLTIR